MSLFNEIAGLKGENLSSALLAHLMLRSPDIRSYMIEKVSDIAPAGPVDVANQFAVFLEQSTKLERSPNDSSPEPNAGRIDIVIETDDAVIGIENKFNAPFQQNQPAGYLESLKERAQRLEVLRGNEFSSVLIVLAPERRRTEINHYLKKGSQDEIAFLSWNDVLDGIQTIEGLSSIDRYLIRQLHAYVDDQVGNFRDLRKLLPHLQRSWRSRGTPAQYKFLNNFIWGFLPEGIRRSGYYQSSVGNDFYGWYLRPHMGAVPRQAWIGFIKLDSTHGRSALVFATSPPDELGTPAMSPSVKPLGDETGWSEDWQLFQIVFDESDQWEDYDQWVEALDPLNTWLQNNLQESTTQ